MDNVFLSGASEYALCREGDLWVCFCGGCEGGCGKGGILNFDGVGRGGGN